jgi:hypothetical protein
MRHSSSARTAHRSIRRIAGCGLAVALVLTSLAHAEGKIENVRTSSQPDLDRIVLDLGAEPVETAQSVGDDRVIVELAADPPVLTRAAERALAKLSGTLERTSRGTRLVVLRDDRSVRVFRLQGDAAAGRAERLVVDLGPRGGGVLPIPEDAAEVPEASFSEAEAVLAEPQPVPRPEPAAAPQTETPEVSPEPVRPSPEPAVERRPSRPAPSEVATAGTQTAALAPRDSPPEAQPAARDFSVLVRDIAIEGVIDEATVATLAELPLPVTPVDGGYVTPRSDAAVLRLPLRELAGTDGQGRELTNGVLSMMVETIAGAYAEAGQRGIQVRISRSSLANLLGRDSDGRLVIEIVELPR